jgi:CIC family chloride channel protein
MTDNIFHSVTEDPDEQPPLSPALMFVLAILVGIFGGFGSIAFKGIIAFVQNLFFHGTFSLHFTPDVHIDPAFLGPWVILVPVVGAVIVTWITRYVAPEARGHGVPEVMNAIHYHDGDIRPITVLAKALASAVSIGTGGSVGREGPIIQIGSAFGSSLGQIWHIPPRQKVVLVGAGAAAGIAATFNAPLGGLAFAIELMLVSVSAQNVALVASATVTATYIGRLYSGIGPSFEIPRVDMFTDHVLGSFQLLLCLPLALLIGAAAAWFVHAIYWFEDRFDELISNDYLRHMTGMLILGLLIYAFANYTGEYYVAGVGYATILDVLHGLLTDPAFLLLLFLGKLLATSLTLGSGASGGVFSPSLFLGATLGAAFADFCTLVIPGLEVNHVIFTIAGMAGMVGASTSAVVTAIVMTFEQTRDYSAILPIITVVALAYVVRTRITTESIYTLKLARRGLDLPQGLTAAVTSTQEANDIMNTDYQCIEYDELAEWLPGHTPGQDARYTIIIQQGQVYGVLQEELRYTQQEQSLDELIVTDFNMVEPATRWPVLMRIIKSSDKDVTLVTYGPFAQDLAGVITSAEITKAVRDAAELME